MIKNMKSKLAHYLLPFLLTGCLSIHCNSSSVENQPLSAEIIMQRAHERAGGPFWQKPTSLTLKGYAVFYENGQAVKNERHNMWRVFEAEKTEAHAANGKVRIESFRDGQPVFIVTYDGQNTYDLRGKQAPSAADQRWASNFGYGVIRHAFDPGYRLERLADTVLHEAPIYTINVVDPSGSSTQFGITQKDFTIVKVAFQTPHGWHERHYSQFFRKPEYSWWQSGKVKLFYDGKRANDVYWEDFAVNEALPDSLFRLSN